uniref:Lipocalin n=1 Tax=Rhipicephalus appendiculatus TaxID=34631 RepID=A0A131YW82_RHIAP
MSRMKLVEKRSSTFILFVLIVLSKCEYIYSWVNEVPDIRKFYVQNEKIWTIISTMWPPKYCQVDVVYTTSQKYAFFNRSYTLKGTRYQEYLLGMFTEIPVPFTKLGTFNAMRIAPRKGTSYISEDQLLYQTDNYTCGVFNVTMLPRTQNYYYDVRVKESALNHSHSSCAAVFRDLTYFEQNTTLFNDSCLHKG